MTKEYEVKEVKRNVLKKVICDDCGKDCTNTYVDIMQKFSFQDLYKGDIPADLIKTICWKCWTKDFQKDFNDNRLKR